MSTAALPPNPGSPEAVNAGCTCAVLDNCRGAGIGGDGSKHGWWITAECPVHAPQTPEPHDS